MFFFLIIEQVSWTKTSLFRFVKTPSWTVTRQPTASVRVSQHRYWRFRKAILQSNPHRVRVLTHRHVFPAWTIDYLFACVCVRCQRGPIRMGLPSDDRPTERVVRGTARYDAVYYLHAVVVNPRSRCFYTLPDESYPARFTCVVFLVQTAIGWVRK